jgi:hypothetical protein
MQKCVSAIGRNNNKRSSHGEERKKLFSRNELSRLDISGEPLNRQLFNLRAYIKLLLSIMTWRWRRRGEGSRGLLMYTEVGRSH